MILNSQLIPTEKLKQVSLAAAQLRGSVEKPVQASIIVPINAQGDLLTILPLLEDLIEYAGPYNLEVVLVINNYSPDNPPAEIETFRAAGFTVVAEPDARRQGQVVILSARAIGAQAAQSDITIHFDADCRIPNPTSLLTWYVDVLQRGAELAYSHVSFYDLRPLLSIHTKIALHHFIRFIKRDIFGIPTTRGSNYAIKRLRFLDLFNGHKISVDMQVGPAVKLSGGKVAYSGRKDRTVFTSGRRFKGGWGKIPRYLRHRLIYNFRSLSMLRKADSSQSWKVFDRENENRMAFGPVSPNQAAGQPAVEPTSNEKG